MKHLLILWYGVAASSFCSNIFVCFNFFRPDVFRIFIFWFIFLFQGIELCAQRIKHQKKKQLILWYGGAASSFFRILSVFIIFRPDFFELYFLGHFLFICIELGAQRIKLVKLHGPQHV